jgi:ATP-binding cassette subfamily G (WHITE) protein 2 (PDR)
MEVTSALNHTLVHRLMPLTRNYGIVIAFFLFFLGTYLVGTEYISAKKSKGEILVFKRGHVPAALKEQEDEEAASPPAGRNIAADFTGSNATENDFSIQKQTAVFHWKDVVYDIKIKGQPRRLLDHVDGWVKPGTLTALMVRKNHTI